MEYGMLIDIGKCMGCRGCQVACKQWNDLAAEKTINQGSYQNPPALSSKTWTLIKFVELEEEGEVGWHFVKLMCMHCKEPACASACPVGALQKTKEGPVVYYDKRCIGCRYCMMACPFGIPKYEWEKPVPLVRKCSFCADRLQAGLTPACAKTCPAGAIHFGERDALIQEAENQIRASGGKYVDHIYGKDEVGGTSVLFISTVPFEELGFPTLENEALPAKTWRVQSAVPAIFGGVVLSLSGIYWLTRRKNQVQEGVADAREKKE